jgi:hypothetical protein
VVGVALVAVGTPSNFPAIGSPPVTAGNAGAFLARSQGRGINSRRLEGTNSDPDSGDCAKEGTCVQNAATQSADAYRSKAVLELNRRFMASAEHPANTSWRARRLRNERGSFAVSLS